MFRLAAACLFLAAPALANGTEVGQIIDWPMPSILNGVSTLPAPDAEGRPHMALVIRRDNSGNIVVQYANTGYADDSVDGERKTHVLEPQADGRYKVLESKTEYRCRRGETPMTWQSAPCP
ncbi:MAG: hypothetical protein EP318_09440 [Rhodobacteraceae bacterium]|nr:MAG: hypothetical protein EP318_09440 [Paracoccaceae bacterium]